MILLQLSSAQGPAECCLAVAKALQYLLAEVDAANIKMQSHWLAVQVLEQKLGPENNTLRSVLLSVDGEGARAFAESWHGTVQWICPSPYRPTHKRKNWFIAGNVFEPTETSNADEIRFESCRASGPGGQHVNNTDSAIRAIHVATGVSVKVQSERSQHANKRLATLLIQHKLNELKEVADAENNALRHQARKQVERGDAKRIFKGEGFKPS